jgi:prepilin-type N-terminal cleavage/methylation domain-containing protein
LDRIGPVASPIAGPRCRAPTVRHVPSSGRSPAQSGHIDRDCVAIRVLGQLSTTCFEDNSMLAGGLLVTRPDSARGGRVRGFSLIELLVVITIIGLLIAILLPAVQAAREATRRMQCVNNLKQLGLAALNYESANGVLPPGSLAAPFDGQPGLTWGLSTFVRVLPFVDNSPIYDAANFSLQAITTANGTLASIGISALWCPSDPFVPEGIGADSHYGAPAGTGISQRHTSYGGCQGTWSLEILPTNPTYALQVSNMNGVIFSCSSVRLSDINDGTGATILFAETAYGRIPSASARPLSRWWQSGYVADTMVAAYYPRRNCVRDLISGDRSTQRDLPDISLVG